MVKSAAKSVSKTLSKPRILKAATILPVPRVPGSIPNSSAIETLTAGAVCTTTCLVGSESAAQTSAVSSFSVIAPVGHTKAHCPQFTQLVSPNSKSKGGATTVSKPRLTDPIAFTP